MKIREIKHAFAEKLTVGESFADDINGVFPIDTEDNLLLSAQALESEDFTMYDDKEKYLIMSRIIDEAKELKMVDKIKPYIEKYNNGGNMFDKAEMQKMIVEAMKSFTADKPDLKDQLQGYIDSLFTVVKDSETVAKLKDEIKTKEDQIAQFATEKEKFENELKEVTEAKVKLESDLRDRDRTIKLAKKFADVKMDADAKQKKIGSMLKISASYDEENFDKYITEEIDFINSFATKASDNAVDLTKASADLPNPPNDDSIDKNKETVKNFLKIRRN